jgi:hypothetical protein
MIALLLTSLCLYSCCQGFVLSGVQGRPITTLKSTASASESITATVKEDYAK